MADEKSRYHQKADGKGCYHQMADGKDCYYQRIDDIIKALKEKIVLCMHIFLVCNDIMLHLNENTMHDAWNVMINACGNENEWLDFIVDETSHFGGKVF